jgi:elongation factor 1-beta
MPEFKNLSTAAGMDALNTHLASHSYVDGYTPSQADVSTASQLTLAIDGAKYVHLHRWLSHILSFPPHVRDQWPGKKAAGASSAAAAAGEEKSEQPGAAKKKPAADDDFMSLDDDDDDEDAAAAILAKKKAAQTAAETDNKKKPSTRTLLMAQKFPRVRASLLIILVSFVLL